MDHQTYPNIIEIYRIFCICRYLVKVFVENASFYRAERNADAV